VPKVVSASRRKSPASKPKSLSFEKRLHHNWQYRRFFNQSELFKLSECLVFRIPNELGHFRLGITLKARGTSLDRNRVKRQIRENMRQIAELLGAFDYNVVVPQSKKMVRPYPEKLGLCLKNELSRALRK
jgi:ribonuclease P protein component